MSAKGRAIVVGELAGAAATAPRRCVSGQRTVRNDESGRAIEDRTAHDLDRPIMRAANNKPVLMNMGMRTVAAAETKLGFPELLPALDGRRKRANGSFPVTPTAGRHAGLSSRKQAPGGLGTARGPGTMASNTRRRPAPSALPR